MVIREKETYLTATEAAKHLGVARGTFYQRYKENLQEYQVGKLKRVHYRLAQIEALHKVQPVDGSVEKVGSDVEQGQSPNIVLAPSA